MANSLAQAIKHATKAFEILERESDRLRRIDEYDQGKHDMPYMPETADQEFKDLAARCITNWVPTLINTPAQALYLDNFRLGAEEVDNVEDSPAWRHFTRSGMAGRQSAVYRGALKFGHSFTVTLKDEARKEIVTKGLSPLRTVALFDDPACDIDPVAGVYFEKWPGKESDDLGVALVWDGQYEWELTFTNGGKDWRKSGRRVHGAKECPLTRFAAYVDLEGRTWGVVEPMLPIQDRVNQTILDLLLAQSYTAWAVRTVTGMAPPMLMEKDKETGEMVPVLDAHGNPIPDKQYLNASRWFYAADDTVKFGQLEGGDLSGFIAAAELAVRHLSALSQTPPHFLLGQIANISAEALEAAETALSRKIEEFRTSFGESWERVFRIFAQIDGDTENGDRYDGEVIWRDMGASSLAQSADALGKFAEALGIPKRGLWGRVPKVSKGEIARWNQLREEDDYERQIVEAAVGRRTGSTPRERTAFASEADEELTSGTSQAAGG